MKMNWTDSDTQNWILILQTSPNNFWHSESCNSIKHLLKVLLMPKIALKLHKKFTHEKNEIFNPKFISHIWQKSQKKIKNSKWFQEIVNKANFQNPSS